MVLDCIIDKIKKDMTKEEAIAAMQEGKKVTHQYFSSDEWMAMREDQIVLEDGVVCSPDEFWLYRQDPEWDDGYELFKLK